MLQYVHRESNHPPVTTKNIPAGINKRLSSLSSDKASFDQAAPPYQKALDENGYHYTLHYEPTTTAKRKNRQRNNILWYNPHLAKMSAPTSDTNQLSIYTLSDLGDSSNLIGSLSRTITFYKITEIVRVI